MVFRSFAIAISNACGLIIQYGYCQTEIKTCVRVADLHLSLPAVALESIRQF
jgi:hypothetical protein